MRLRAKAVTLVAVTVGFLVPLTAPAEAVTTTSTLVAYTADTNGNGLAEIYTRPADGSGSATRLYQNTHDVWLPALSPDGTKVAYLLNDAEVDGIPIYRLYVRTSTPGGSDPGTLLLNLAVTGSVSWSNDGTQIIASTVDIDTFSTGTYIVAADNNTAPVLVPTTDEQYGEEPSLSPSGDVVAIDAFDEEGEYIGIDLISLDSGERARIAGTTGAGSSDPSWSPDGQYIVFQRALPTCGVGLYRVPASGGTVVTIREVENHFLGSAEYSEDGTQLFWTDVPMSSCGTSGKGEIWVGDAEGNSAVDLTNTPDVSESGSTVAGGTQPAADVTAPGAPTVNAEGIVSATTAKIAWTPAGNDTVEYVVRRVNGGDTAPATITDGTAVYRGPARTATATGLTTGAVYDLYVFAIDSSGNVSATAAMHSVKPIAPPVMTAIPRVGTVTKGQSYFVRWTGAGDTFDLQEGRKVRTAPGVWSSAPAYVTISTGTTDHERNRLGSQGSTYYYRARAHDGLGNVTVYSGTPSSVSVPVDDVYGGISYSPSWVAKTGNSDWHWMATYHTTIGRGAVMTYRADTSRFVLIGDRCDTCGKFEVWIDGVKRTTIDTHSVGLETRKVLYASSRYATIKPHTIKIVALGTSGRPRVTIDAIALQR